MEVGELVNVFNRGGRGFFFEGQARIIKVLDRDGNRAIVRFGKEHDTVERFVDPAGQNIDNPEDYTQGLNKAIGL